LEIGSKREHFKAWAAVNLVLEYNAESGLTKMEIKVLQEKNDLEGAFKKFKKIMENYLNQDSFREFFE